MTDDRSSAGMHTDARAGTRAGLALLLAGTAAIGVAYGAAIIAGTAPSWASWALAFGSAATPVGLFVIGASTRRVLTPRVALVLVVLFVVLAAAFGAALALPPDEGAGGRLLLGLPLRLAIVFYGVGIVPLVTLPVVFALTFRDDRGADAKSG